MQHYSTGSAVRHGRGRDTRRMTEIVHGEINPKTLSDLRGICYAGECRVTNLAGKLLRTEPATYLDTSHMVLWWKDKAGHRHEKPIKRRFNP